VVAVTFHPKIFYHTIMIAEKAAELILGKVPADAAEAG